MERGHHLQPADLSPNSHWAGRCRPFRSVADIHQPSSRGNRKRHASVPGWSWREIELPLFAI